MAHISKLWFYSDASLAITEEIKNQIALDEHQEEMFSKILQVRKRKSIWEFLVAWKGFDEESWGMHRYFILMYLIWFKTLFFLMHLLAERKLLQSFLIFKNWTSDSLKLDLLLEVSSKLLGVDQSQTAFLPNKQEAPQPLTLGHLERWMTILESLLKQDLWVSTFSIADLESWWVGRSLLKKALDNFQCPDLEHLEGQLVESSIFRCSHMSQRTWLCSSQHCSESRRLEIFCHSEFLIECGSRFSKGSQGSYLVSHATLKKGTPCRNSCPMILLTSYSAEDSSAAAEWNGVGGGKMKLGRSPFCSINSVCDDDDIWFFELRLML